MMTTTTIRVTVQTRQLLQELARQTDGSMQSVLAEALEQYRRQRLLAAANAAYAALRAQTDAWAELERERAAWDNTLADGLEEV